MRPRTVLAFLAVSVLAVPAARPAGGEPERPRGLVLFIADGFGPASLTMARAFAGEPLALDRILVGGAGTRASSSLVTDSAASATALACGVKTYNGAIGVVPGFQPVGSILEAAEARGWTTALVSTARVTHATPAAFASHVPSRGFEDAIAEQILDSGVDLVMGGGARHFAGAGGGGARDDGRDLLGEAREAGWTVVRELAELPDDPSLPLLALFTQSHMSYEIDRDAEAEPSLEEMTRRALALVGEGEAGFFLMIEAGRIDHAGHQHDPAAMVREVLAYDRAVAAALEWVEEAGDCLLVCTADHETGGLSLGRELDGESAGDWEPDALRPVDASIGAIAGLAAASGDPMAVLRERAGIDDLEASRLESLRAALDGPEPAWALQGWLAEELARRALVDWTTWGHTGVDVQVFAAGRGADRFRGFRENDALGRALGRALGLSVGEPLARDG